MTYLCSIFFIFVASVEPLSKNKSRIIIQKCRNFCKQLTLPGRTVQQLPFFKTVRLYTVGLFGLHSNGETGMLLPRSEGKKKKSCNKNAIKNTEMLENYIYYIPIKKIIKVF